MGKYATVVFLINCYTNRFGFPFKTEYFDEVLISVMEFEAVVREMALVVRKMVTC